MKFVFERVQERRAVLGLSQSELAKKGDLKLHDVQNIENNKVNRPSHDAIVGLCKGLDVAPAFFYDDYAVDSQHSCTPAAS